MIGLAVASKSDLLFPVDSHDGRVISNIDNSKDFATVLEKTKEIQSGLNSKDNSSYNLSKLSAKTQKIKEDTPKVAVKNIVTEDTVDELLDMLNSIYQMILFLKENPDKIGTYDVKTLKLNLEELSDVCNKLSSMDRLDFSDKIDTKILDELITLLNGENDKLKFIEKEELVELKETLIKLDSFKENREENIEKDNKVKSQGYIEENLLTHMDKSLEYNKSNEEIPKKVLNGDGFEPKRNERASGKEILNRVVKSEITIEDNYETKDESQTFYMDSNSSTFELFDNVNGVPNTEINIENFQQIDKEDVIQQIVDKINLSLSNEKQEIKLKLKPDILGELLLKMELKDGNLTAKLIVDNYKTKELIETNLIQLKEQIKDNGLEIRTFEVFVGTNEDFEKNERERFYSNKNSHRVKIKANGFKELQSYDDSYGKVKHIPYYDGKLNLFA